MFPTAFHVDLAFTTFDVHNRKVLGPSELDHALQAVGLGDAPKQVVFGIIRQARNEKLKVRPRSGTRVPHAAQNASSSSQLPPSPHRNSITAASSMRFPVPHPGGTSSASSWASNSYSGSSTVDTILSHSGSTIDAIAAGAMSSSSLASIDAVTRDEFTLLVKELAPPKGSSEELWKGFKCLDMNQTGRVTSDSLLAVLRRDEERLVDSIRRAAQSVRTGHVEVSNAASSPRHSRDESLLKAMVEQMAEYRDKGLAFDEWKAALHHIPVSSS